MTYVFLTVHFLPESFGATIISAQLSHFGELGLLHRIFVGVHQTFVLVTFARQVDNPILKICTRKNNIHLAK